VVNLEHKVRSFLVLQPRGGDSSAVIEFFRTHDVLGKAVQHAGAWSAELHMPLSGSGPLLVTALWDSAEAYTGWRNHPIRAELNPHMERLVEDIDGTPVVGSGVYQVVVSASR
jgi:heme-degrading monooxygenase HmoA